MSASSTLKLTLPHTTGPEVLRIQEALGRLGITVEADAVFGYGTESAVKEFQRRNGLKEDGTVNESTYELLFGGSK